ncbi:hypothetical protein ABW20_dc0106121 [Dactylellina cionopaga]|nr:hypothetical protein ABW20_dc0106121 [Dactylellina cionopaga]
MFAVPAFSSLSSASLKSSFGKGSEKTTDTPAPPATGANAVSTSSNRKRKRSRAAESIAVGGVSSEDIGELWSKVIEGKTASSTGAAGDSTKPAAEAQANGEKKKNKKDKNKKKRKHEHDDSGQPFNKDNAHEHKSPEPVSTSEPKSLDQTSGQQHSEGEVAEGRMSETSKRNDTNKTRRRDEKVKQTKDKKQDKQDKQEKQMNDDDPFTTALTAAAESKYGVDAPSKAPILTPLQEKMRQKLSGARFRHLNQLLYTTPSQDSLALFKSQPDMFTDYHTGFRQQVESWPENPVEVYVKRLFARGKLRESGFRSGKHKGNGISSVNANPLGADGFQDAMESLPLPRAKDGYATVIDLGCGEAALAKAITSAKPRPKIKVQSYDLHAPNPLVTVADIANLPLRDGSVDVAIFCLALMGTNWITMVEEAVRVLRNGGELWIAEIKSRFARTKTGKKDDDSGKEGKKGKGKKNAGRPIKDDTNPADAFIEEQDESLDQNRWAAGEQNFIEALGKRGLRLKNRNGSNKMFVLLDFEKIGKGGQYFQIPPKPDMHGRISKKFHTRDEPEVDEVSILQPCLYKIR